MVFTKLLLENALAIRPCNCEAASEPLLPKVARCIPVLSSRYTGKCAAHVLKRSCPSNMKTWTGTQFSFRTVLLLTNMKEQHITQPDKCNASINWCGYLIITWIITSYLGSFYRHNWLLAKHDKVGVDVRDWNWRLTVVQNECKTKFTYRVEGCILNENRHSTYIISNLVTCRFTFGNVRILCLPELELPM